MTALPASLAVLSETWATALGCISGVNISSLSLACFSGASSCTSSVRKIPDAWAYSRRWNAARPASNERFAARIDPDGDTLAELTSGWEPVGRVGTVTAGDIPAFRL